MGFVGVLVMVRPGEGSLQLGALVALANAATVAHLDPAGEAAVRFRDAADDPDPVRDLLDPAAGAAGDLGVALARRLGLDAGGRHRAAATVGQYFWVQAFKAGEMSAVAPFEYLRLPFAVFVGWLIWGEMPVIWTYVGAAIVIASALYIAHREHQLARERRRAARRSAAGSG